MRLVGRGHGAIRATHTKTIEFSIDSEITARATCVIGVAAEAEDGRRLAGPIRITLTAGGESFSLEALANPAWEPGGAAIVRRSGLRLPGTLATEATAAASDLPRALVTALQDPGAVVEARIDPIRGRPAVVLFALDPDAPPDPRLTAELSAADVVVAEDDTAARMLGEPVAAGPVAVARRVLVVAAQELPGATVAAALPQVDVDVLGLPAPLAAAAASPSRGPVLLAPPTSDVRALLRGTPATTRIVLRTRADRVTDVLKLAGEVRGTSGAVLVVAHDRPRRVDGDAELSGREPVHLCLDAATESDALDPAVRAAVAGLLADGVPTKTAANALATLTGWDRRRAYAAVLDWPAI